MSITLKARIELKRGLLADRPATGLAAEPYFAEDTGWLYVWNPVANAWNCYPPATSYAMQSGLLADRPAGDSTHVSYYATDTNHIYLWNAVADEWFDIGTP